MIFKTPDMTDVDSYNSEIAGNAESFTASLLLGRGQFANAKAISLNDIRAAAAKLKTENPATRAEPIISAIDAMGNKTIISGKPYKMPTHGKANMNTTTKPATGKLDLLTSIGKLDFPKAEKPAKAAKAEKAPKADKPAKVAKAPKEKVLGARAQIEADAAKGILPPKPDFSADTHKPYRKRLEALIALVEAADIAGLTAFVINPASTSPKAMDRYRNLAVTALKAKAAK